MLAAQVLILILVSPFQLRIFYVSEVHLCAEEVKGAVQSSRGELVPAGEQGRVGLVAKTVLGFTPPSSFPHKSPGLVHQQLGACRRGVVCMWEVISLSVHPPTTALISMMKDILPPWGRSFLPVRNHHFLIKLLL